MLALIPILTFICIFLVLGNMRSTVGWRRSFLRAAVVWGSFMILVTEVLSIFRAMIPFWVAFSWALPVLVATGWFIWRAKRGQEIRLPQLRLPKGWLDRALLLGVLIVVVVTAVVAWLTPPQTWDSLNYHLSRVAHWAQDRAVRHFATGIGVQNSMPPGAEMAILQFYVLAGGDRLANFVQWFSMIGSLVGVSLVAMQLGAGLVGQIVATLFAATIPMGIVQASNTMTDYVVALWMICIASESLHLLTDSDRSGSLVFTSLAAGLALVTKPTALAYLLPFAVLVAILLLRRTSLWKSLLWGLMAIFIVAALNGGHFMRNYNLYGHPVGPAKRIEEHAIKRYEPRVFLSNLLRNASLQAGSPFPVLNKMVYVSVLKVHIKMGIGVSDPDTTATGSFNVGRPSTHEDLVGNPLQALLILILFFLILVVRRIRNTSTLMYVITVATTFLTFSLLFKWQIFGSRYHLPFFVLFAPAVGFSLSRLLSPNVARIIVLILAVTSWPWLVSINSRPLIPTENSYVGSILFEPREKLLFANGLFMMEAHKDMAEMIREQECRNVGLMLSGGGAEYTFWVLLGAPDPDLYMEWIVSGPPSERLRSPDFEPCAVICERCPEEWEQTRGLPIRYRGAGYRLFIGENN